MDDKNTTSSSATRHAVTGLVATALGVWLGKKGVTLGPDSNAEIATAVVGAVVAAGTAASAGLGALWRRLIS